MCVCLLMVFPITIGHCQIRMLWLSYLYVTETGYHYYPFSWLRENYFLYGLCNLLFCVESMLYYVDVSKMLLTYYGIRLYKSTDEYDFCCGMVQEL